MNGEDNAALEVIFRLVLSESLSEIEADLDVRENQIGEHGNAIHYEKFAD